jgi:hypothetical protein
MPSPTPLRRALGLILLVAAPAGARAAEAPSVSDAPLGLETPGPLRALFLDLPLADARGPGAPALDLQLRTSNSWSVPTRLVRGGRVAVVQQDAQTETLVARAELPWSRLAGGALAARTSTAVEARLILHWGGFTDGGIESWHHLVGSWNFLREEHARDAVALRLGEQGRPPTAALDHARAGLGDVALRTSVRVAEGGRARGAPAWAIALRADLKVPTGALSRFAGSGGWDAGLGLGATFAPARRWTVHGLASLRAVSRLPRSSLLQPRPLQGGLDLSIVFRPARRLALVLEDRISSPLLRAGWSLPAGTREPEATAAYALLRAHNQISGGIRWGELTIFLSEDFTLGSRADGDHGPSWFYDSSAPDVVLGVTWARRR